jgi:hypothetical protein
MDVSCQLHGPYRFSPGKTSPRTHCMRDWMDPQIRSGRCREETNFLPLLGIQPRFPGHVARSSVAILSDLSDIWNVS